MTKNTSTPTKPPRHALGYAWNATTARTATARRPSMSGRYAGCALPALLSPMGPAPQTIRGPRRGVTRPGAANGSGPERRGHERDVVRIPRGDHEVESE